MALEQRVRKAVAALYDDPGLRVTDPVVSDVVQRLARKRERVARAYALNGSRDFAAEVRNNPTYLVDLWENDPIFRSFLGREIQYFHAIVGAGQFRLCMWTEDGRLVRRVKTDAAALIFANPFLEERQTVRGTAWKVIVQRWERPKSITRGQNKHLYANRAQGYSYYDQEFSRSVDEVDRAVFGVGIGIVRSIDRLWLFGKFRSPIGVANPGGPTCYVRGDVHRTQRGRRRADGKRNGYRSTLHTHPISRADIQRHYGQVAAALLSRLDANELRWPERTNGR